MIGVSCCAVSHQFRINMGISGKCMLQFFQNHYSGAFSQYKSATILIKWYRCTKRICGCGQCSQIGKSGYGCRRNTALCTSRQHNFRVSVLNCPKGVPDTVGSGCTGCHYIGTFSLQTKLDGHISCCHIRDHQWYHKRIHPSRSFGQNLFVFFFDNIQGADSGADGYACTERIFLFHIQSCIFKGFSGGSYRKLGKCFHSAGCPCIHALFCIKILHFRCQLYLIIRCIKFRNFPNSNSSRFDGIPEFLHGISNGCNRSETGHHNSSFHACFLSFTIIPTNCSAASCLPQFWY